MHEVVREQSQFFYLNLYLQGQFTEKQFILLTSVVSFVNEQISVFEQIFLSESFFSFSEWLIFFALSFKTRGYFSE